MDLVGDRCPLRGLALGLTTVVAKPWVRFLVLLLWYGRGLAGLAVAAPVVKAGTPHDGRVFIVANEVCILCWLKALGEGLLA